MATLLSKSDPFTREVLEQFAQDTPFLFFEKRIEENYQEFLTVFPGSLVHYAMKANSEPEVLETLLAAGSGFEVASMHELSMLQAIGVPSERIIFGSAVKSISHIKAFVAYGVDRFAFDSYSELEKIAALAPGARVYVRASVNDTGSVFKFSEKFGTPKENIVPLLLRAVELGMQPYGISFNVGSQASNPKAWAEAICMLCPILEELHRKGITLEIFDIGGGYPCSTYSSNESMINLAEIGKYIYEEYAKLPYCPTLILEPGRALVATSGVLVANVIARIERNEHTWLFLDVGVYNGLYETMAYQGSTRYRVTMIRQSFDVGESPFALAGPTGDSPDVITREVFLPSDVSVGDRLIVHDVGAYSLVNVCAFNGFPKPSTHFI